MFYEPKWKCEIINWKLENGNMIYSDSFNIERNGSQVWIIHSRGHVDVCKNNICALSFSEKIFLEQTHVSPTLKTSYAFQGWLEITYVYLIWKIV